MVEIKIENEEIETSRKTGDNIFDIKKDATTNIEDDLGTKNINGIDKEKTEKNQTPAEISHKKYYDSEERKNNAKTKLFDAIKYAIYILLGLGAIYGIFWAYKVNNIAEPIGGMKADIQNLKDNLKDTRDQVQKLQDRVDEINGKNIK